MGGYSLSNQSIIKSILDDYEKYLEDKQIENFQFIFETRVSALEGIERSKLAEIKEIINEVEYARFLFSQEQQPQKVKEAINKFKEIMGLD